MKEGLGTSEAEGGARGGTAAPAWMESPHMHAPADPGRLARHGAPALSSPTRLTVSSSPQLRLDWSLASSEHPLLAEWSPQEVRKPAV